jgi:hypothetical protein
VNHGDNPRSLRALDGPDRVLPLHRADALCNQRLQKKDEQQNPEPGGEIFHRMCPDISDCDFAASGTASGAPQA